MAKPKWTDDTSYSQGQKNKIPDQWKIVLPGCEVMVHRHISHESDVWFLSTRSEAIKLEREKLETRGGPETAKAAQREALQVLASKVFASRAALDDLAEEIARIQ